MADNAQGPQDAPPLPPSSGSGATPVRPPPLPPPLPAKKPAAGKVMVTLASVAKAPPAGTQTLTPLPASSTSPELAPVRAPGTILRPPPLPPRQGAPGGPLMPPRQGGPAEVKLPPKSTGPKWTSLSGSPVGLPVTSTPEPVEEKKSAPPALPKPAEPKAPAEPSAPAPVEAKSPASPAVPPPQPARAPVLPKEGKKHTGKIILNLDKPASDKKETAESIFADPPAEPEPEKTPEGWKRLEPGELKSVMGDLQSLDVFSRSQQIIPKTEPTIVIEPAAPATPAPATTPVEAIVPPQLPAKPVPVTVVPPVLPPATPAPVTTPVEAVAPPQLPAKPAPVTVVPPSLPPPIPTPVTKPVEDTAPTQLPPKPMPVRVLPPESAAPVALTPPTKPVETITSPNLPPSSPFVVAPPVTPASSAPATLPPPVVLSAPAPEVKAPVRPPPLPPAKTVAVAAPAHPVHVAPPLLEPVPEASVEKLRPPHLPTEIHKSEATSPVTPEAEKPLQAVPNKPLAPPALPSRSKVTGPITLRGKPDTVPASISQSIKAADAKPALRPPVLPNRAMVKAAEVEVPPAASVEPAEKPAATTPPPSAPTTPVTAKSPDMQPVKVVPKSVMPSGMGGLSSAPVTSQPVSPTPIQSIKVADAPGAATLPFGRTPEPKPKAVDKPVEKPSAAVVHAPALIEPVLTKAPEVRSAPVKLPEKPVTPPATTTTAKVEKTAKVLPPTRAERAKKRRSVGLFVFWGLFVPAAMAGLYFGGIYFSRETKVEGQVIPPSGLTLNNEVWIISDIRSQAAGVAEDLVRERSPLLDDIQEKREHVQRAQADIASREERIRLLLEQVQASKDEATAVVKQARDATQQIWDGEGAQLDTDYTDHLNALQRAIADRAKSLNLKYQPDDSFHSPEVWANAYRLALYEVPAGVDGVKEHQWLSDQMKQWRDYVKAMDVRKEQLRDKAAQVKMSPTPKIADLNGKIEELQHRIEATASEEGPIKMELQQAQSDLDKVVAEEAGLDDKGYKQLDAIPADNILGNKRFSIEPNGRFSWTVDDSFAEGEKEHRYWIFSLATRADGRQYWALGQFSIAKDHKVCVLIEPGSFISTKAILRPNLSPEEQAQ